MHGRSGLCSTAAYAGYSAASAMPLFLLKRCRPSSLTLCGGVGGGVCGARTAARQRGADDPGRHRHARVDRRAREASSAWTSRRCSAMPTGSAACCAAHTAQSIAYDTPTGELIAERLQVTLPLAAAGDGADGGGRARAAVSTPRRATTALGDVGVMALASWASRMPELLVRDPADPAVRGEAAMGQRRRLSGLERGRRRRAVGRACKALLLPARGAGGGAGRDPGAL